MHFPSYFPFTVNSLKSWCALTLEATQHVQARGSIEAGIGVALILVCLTVSAGISEGAATQEGAHGVYTLSMVFTGRGT